MASSRFPVFVSLFALLVATLGARGADPELKSWLGSSFLLPGEQTQLILSIASTTRPDATPSAPRTDNIKVEFLDDHLYQQPNRQLVYIYRYSLISYAEGTHTIPPFNITIDGKQYRSQPVALNVSSIDKLNWGTHRISNNEIKYASAVFVPERIPYEGETIPAEAKVYLPATISVVDASIAELEHDGVVAWRFEAARLKYARNTFTTEVRLAGENYVGVTFRSTVAPIRAGEVSLGPGQARLSVGTRLSSGTMIIQRSVATSIPIKGNSFGARKLPPSPLPGFDKAVGSFKISALADTSNLQEGDPISVRLSVSGIGNLDTLGAPKLLTDEQTWKVYEPSRLPRQGERRDVSGMVTFSQIIRPLVAQKTIPPFKLVFFNPKTERYESTETLPIPFAVTAARRSTAPVAILPDLKTPVEDMQGILGLVQPGRTKAATGLPGILRFWHIIPAMIALVLLARITQRRILPRFAAPTREKEVLTALARIEHTGPATRDFLRASGQFIESWIPSDLRDDEIESLLRRRDSDCYRPDSADEELGGDERSDIIRRLRKRALSALPVMLAACLLASGSNSFGAPILHPESIYAQAEAAWTEGSYRAAIELYHSAHKGADLPADVLYNLGNCYFQLGETGLAALYFHRALHENPDHAEAKQNLRFLKRKTGAIVIERPLYQEWLGKLDRSTYSTLLAAGCWTFGLTLLGLFAGLTRPLRLLAWSGIVVGQLAVLTAAVTLILYPDDTHFAPPVERAVVVTSAATTARTEASTSGSKVIDVPPGSLCRPLAQRGPWVYVELADHTRGWLRQNEVKMVLPTTDSALGAPDDLGA